MCSGGRQASDINLPLEGTRTHKYCAEWAFTFDDLPAISLGAVSAVRRKVGPFVFQGGLTYLGRFALAHTMHILRSESQSLDTFSSETLAGR